MFPLHDAHLASADAHRLFNRWVAQAAAADSLRTLCSLATPCLRTLPLQTLIASSTAVLHRLQPLSGDAGKPGLPGAASGVSGHSVSCSFECTHVSQGQLQVRCVGTSPPSCRVLARRSKAELTPD